MTILRIVAALGAAGCLGLVTYGSFQGGDVAVLAGYTFLALTFPFGLAWAWLAIPCASSPMASTAAEIAGMIAVDLFTLFFWFVLLPLLWGRVADRRHAGLSPR